MSDHKDDKTLEIENESQKKIVLQEMEDLSQSRLWSMKNQKYFYITSIIWLL